MGTVQGIPAVPQPCPALSLGFGELLLPGDIPVGVAVMDVSSAGVTALPTLLVALASPSCGDAAEILQAVPRAFRIL